MPTYVRISTKSAEVIRDWVRDLCSKAHMIPNPIEGQAIIELHGAIEDAHYLDKQGVEEDNSTHESEQVSETNNPLSTCNDS
jgi:hypothetical protein